ncbi:hypothetical protein SAMN05421640_0454 [Ekhidna lutea]|uniref:Uncharacterized protein n=1 Tax=Ekhidna lutea TaxID=447679 RepID=A0A239F4G3_EKHLU|nr:DUF6090 family protein [Ekhidna lutea]SNS51052.1 hypothetical protein SAMN05421640_0454 [Ekhidna lutea]
MLFLLRKVRRKLLQKNKVTTYLLYAIGEIVLVVIGIIIAVQINSWNDARLNQKKERVILKDLHQEFQINKTKLDAAIRHHQTLAEATGKIMSLIGEPKATLAQHNLDSLIYLSLDYTDFNASQSVIMELISSGRLNLISSDELRSLIFEWVSEMDEKKEGYETMDEISQSQTLPYLTQNATMKDIDFYGLGRTNGRSKFASKNHPLFQDLVFENHMDNQFWGITNYIAKLNRLETIIDRILKQTNTQAIK